MFIINYKTKEDVILFSLSIIFGELLIHFFMSFVTLGSVWEWAKISNNVILFVLFFSGVLYIVEESLKNTMLEN